MPRRDRNNCNMWCEGFSCADCPHGMGFTDQDDVFWDSIPEGFQIMEGLSIGEEEEEAA